jgi:UDP-GlcNAc:undecaprenyl-phosphate GlcNAc-1-phosphate transferase
MGDAGALFLGVLVAVLTIQLDPGISPQLNSFAILLGITLTIISFALPIA